jgi:hypothetical protein
MTAPKLDLDELRVTTMRTLAIDAIQQADSGFPGTPMGMSPTVYCLWQRLLRFDPADSIGMNRDRSGQGPAPRGEIEMHPSVASGHAGLSLKEREYLGELGHTVEDLGTGSSVPGNFPDFAEAVAKESC